MSGEAIAAEVRPVLEVGATLGEGPVWDARDGVLWFVDIKQRRVYRHDPARGATEHWTAPEQVGWVLPAAEGGMIAGLKTGVHRFDPASGAFTLHHDPEPALPGNRLNDATTDAAGRIWFGSMDDGEQGLTGRLYRLDPDGLRESGLPPVAITNGPAISGDGRTLYHTDTAGGVIWRVALDEQGLAGAAEIFTTIPAAEGHPDGSVVDAEDCLWVGLYGGWGVRRYDPSGRLIGTVAFPVANITKIAFGGPDLRTAYATTARQGLDAQALAAQPLAGALFAFEPGVAGRALVPARI
ncbi:SMP-30/gluconolactonase/LRE family protein [Sphingomonas morindae]|uniref:SMP-30/gluconolactonase/LRE family protein n=1 Tax=Sphingomonas morindae TaxID=1541170 RepID=A0ABY4X616_9SPHN|nr:SMP-30/gluconolactonase/LRE family protein [Sphingomonas morindae]USI72343.1 SMP-30/gluconolactonase/LRE family protein [Sphingomonas morindae]